MRDTGMTPYSVIVEQSSSLFVGDRADAPGRVANIPLDGIFCTNIDLARSVPPLRIVGAAGLKIPDDMAIAGFTAMMLVG